MPNIFDQVESNINALAEQNVWLSGCASQGQMAAAREGRLSLPLGISKPVPGEWLRDVKGKRILCLAGAGGLQGPILAAAGAEVTVRKCLKRTASWPKNMGLPCILNTAI